MADGGQQHAPIQFSLGEAPKDPSELEEERKKHQQRAERFGLGFRDPGQRKEFRMEARKERVAHEGFVTGIDMFSEEERSKRAARAAKFGLERPEPLQYAPDPLELKKAERGAKFGTGYHPESALMDMDLFEERTDAPADAPRRPDAVYLYGVDVLSSSDVKGYFGDYGPRFVEWINDSSCCVLFADAASAARAIVGTGHPLPPDQQAPDAGGQAGLDPTSVESLPYLWHKGRPFVKGGTPISLMYRMATEADKKDYNAPRRSRRVGRGRAARAYLWQTAGGGGRGGRGGARRKRGGPDGGGDGMDGYEEYGPGGGGDEGGEGEGGGRGRRRRARRKRVKQADGSYRDVEMEDAESGGEDGGGGSGGDGGGAMDGEDGGGGRRRRGGEAAAEPEPEGPEAAAKAVATTEERFGVPDLRALLKHKDGGGGGGGGGAGGGGGGGEGEEGADRIDKLRPDTFEEVEAPADDEPAGDS
ncbi:MAG: hypothetical protein J3K34DRAFT_525865 [Monoraphidium minutum]|nr:MAG: hypothetical protein J3K34DRAFT_525865 [Monoraphidium minutum]